MRLVLCALLAVLVAPAAATAQPQPPGPPQAPPAVPPRAQLPAEIAPTPAPEKPAVQEWISRWDELWKKRDDPTALRDLEQLIKEKVTADPAGFDTNWRKSSFLAWVADGYPDGSDEKSTLGKGAWDAGDKAVLAKPDDVRGQYSAGVGVGLYSEGVGILTALSQGLEGKFRERVLAALKIDKDYLDGAPQVVWGRYFFKLPWPKRDVDESIKVLKAVVQSHPNNWRAKIYLADSLADDGKDVEAKKLVQSVIDAPGGLDLPEEHRMKERARKWMEQH
jgi:hypothetical protein